MEWNGYNRAVKYGWDVPHLASRTPKLTLFAFRSHAGFSSYLASLRWITMEYVGRTIGAIVNTQVVSGQFQRKFLSCFILHSSVDCCDERGTF
jgi:hypothetical protein